MAEEVEAMTGITDEMIEAAARALAVTPWDIAPDDLKRVIRHQAERVLAAGLAGRAVVDLPANWREQLAALERYEYAAASEAGRRPSVEQRAAFEGGVDASAEWFGARIVAAEVADGGVPMNTRDGDMLEPVGTPDTRTHHLKTWPDYWLSLEVGAKTFEVRRDDRGFQPGDTLVLQEWDPTPGEYTGRELRRRVTYVLRDAERFGLRDGFVVLGLADQPPGSGTPDTHITEDMVERGAANLVNHYDQLPEGIKDHWRHSARRVLEGALSDSVANLNGAMVEAAARALCPTWDDTDEDTQAQARSAAEDALLAGLAVRPTPEWLVEVLHVVHGFAKREHEPPLRVMVPAHAEAALANVPDDVLRKARVPLRRSPSPGGSQVGDQR